eukprot:CAMPEP_0172168052 /NCGR_PEP_ID=MMETSP1050-20130122/9917_1 /TAXON_ID=233186 /ORGANISM="Cryptomonas curvata, Strain CCAP979/52" /LENGTH=101 /DNA_ID=CAMNT_0012838919 /DNA_START=170 /DNA_END=473 /DNA_ORIENTATION=-
MLVNPNLPSLESPAQLARQAAQLAFRKKLAHEKKEAAIKAAYCAGAHAVRCAMKDLPEQIVERQYSSISAAAAAEAEAAAEAQAQARRQPWPPPQVEGGSS